MSRSVKTVVHIACDLGLIVVAGLLSILVRFEFTLPEQYLLIFIRKLPILASIRLICYYIFGMYNQLWRYASVNELVTIVEAGSVASVFDWLFLHLTFRTLSEYEGAFSEVIDKGEIFPVIMLHL
ncbi:MAG: hypothetical protein HPY52_13800 [Firmicutes bacterium]|nr:hypothetical protein [Bacillota bacterium]